MIYFPLTDEPVRAAVFGMLSRTSANSLQNVKYPILFRLISPVLTNSTAESSGHLGQLQGVATAGGGVDGHVADLLAARFAGALN